MIHAWFLWNAHVDAVRRALASACARIRRPIEQSLEHGG